MEFGVRHYPQLEIDLDKLEDNLRALKSRMDASGIRLAGVVKGFNGLPRRPRSMRRRDIPALPPPVWSSFTTCG